MNDKSTSSPKQPIIRSEESARLDLYRDGEPQSSPTLLEAEAFFEMLPKSAKKWDWMEAIRDSANAGLPV